MSKKLSKVGNSLAVLIEKPVLEILGWSRDTSLSIQAYGERLIVEPLKEKVNVFTPKKGKQK